MKKTQVPTESEVRKFFQQSYYTTQRYEPETGNYKIKYGDMSGCVYPMEKENE